MKPTDEQYKETAEQLSQLPNTGLPLEAMAIVAILLIASGFWLRKVSKDNG